MRPGAAGTLAAPEAPAREPAAAAGRTAVRAHAVVRVEAGSDGRARVAELRSAVPLILRHTATSRPGAPDPFADPAPGPGTPGAVAGLTPPPLPTVTLHLVGGAAGPLAGDELRLEISVGSGARLVLRSVAATLAMPGHGPGASVLEIQAEVAAGGALDLLPEPTVAVRGCRHRLIGRARVAPGGWLRWREEILLGRFHEPSGHLETDLRVDVGAPAAPGGPTTDYLPLLRQQLTLGPDVPGIAGAALLGAARCVGSLLIAAPPGPADGGRDAASALAGVTAAVSAAASRAGGGDSGGAAVLPLAGPGVLVTALAPDAVTLRRRLGG